MQKYKSLIILGTSHIARDSIREINSVFEKEKPDVVALELDEKRLYGLLKNEAQSNSISNIFRLGLKGYLFALIGGYIQKKLGSIVGIKPGSDMLSAFKLAQKNNVQVALIDRDIEITLKRFSKKFSWRERWNLFVDLFQGLFFKKQKVKLNLSTVPNEEFITKAILQLKKRYPNIYSVLIAERNKIMARNLFLLTKKTDKKILAIVGAGHEKELVSLVKDFENSNLAYS